MQNEIPKLNISDILVVFVIIIPVVSARKIEEIGLFSRPKIIMPR